MLSGQSAEAYLVFYLGGGDRLDFSLCHFYPMIIQIKNKDIFRIFPWKIYIQEGDRHQIQHVVSRRHIEHL